MPDNRGFKENAYDPYDADEDKIEDGSVAEPAVPYPANEPVDE